MGIIKQDIKAFIKPTLIYIVITQLLIYLGHQVSNLVASTNSIIVEYFITFVLALCIITVIVYTILFAIYFNTKSNNNHRMGYQLTDGYGLYRFLTSLGFIVMLAVNILAGLQLNGFEVFEILKDLRYYEWVGSLFFLVPLFTIVIISIGHAHQRKIVRNIEAIVSIIALFIGIYIAGNLYYFGNQQQGVAVLVVLFIPLAILYMSIKERNSEHRIYKVVVVMMCVIVGLISLGLLVTSDFTYDTDQIKGEDKYTPQYFEMSSPYSSEIIDTEYGQVIHVLDDGNGEMFNSELYVLTTDQFTYRINIYDQSELHFTAYQLDNANQYTVYSSDYQTEPEVVADTYDQASNTHFNCTAPLSDINDDKCQIDSEVIDVYTEFAANLKPEENQSL